MCVFRRLTLELLLRGEWAETDAERRTRLLDAVSAARGALPLPEVRSVCDQVRALADGPWEQPVLKRLLAKETVTEEQGQCLTLSVACQQGM